mmetsp:Transcript_71571/g.132092  ORF Transcript_71571/g.132092 Transcript_71571/m.132092 type:complete len:149 (+) Transcript_71571:69-515(+)
MQKVVFVLAFLACAAQAAPEPSDALAKLLLARKQAAAFQTSAPGARLAAGSPTLARSRPVMKMDDVELRRRVVAGATALTTALATSLPAFAGESKTYDVNPFFFALFMLYPFAVAVIKDIVVTEKDNPLVMSRGDLEEIGKIIGSKYT